MSCEGPSPTREGFYGRFEALKLYKITDVTMFMMPTAETWMPWLRKWKNSCVGCPNGGSLSCWTVSPATIYKSSSLELYRAALRRWAVGVAKFGFGI